MGEDRALFSLPVRAEDAFQEVLTMAPLTP
jgi:hypothetical protein